MSYQPEARERIVSLLREQAGVNQMMAHPVGINSSCAFNQKNFPNH
jgi:hypothetical protein